MRPSRILPGYKSTNIGDLIEEIKATKPNFTDEQLDTMLELLFSAIPGLHVEHEMYKANLIRVTGRVYLGDSVEDIEKFALELATTTEPRVFILGKNGFILDKTERGNYYLQCLKTKEESK